MPFAPTVTPAAWLQERGFDPKGDLCLAIMSVSRPWSVATCTAMFEAAYAGDLGVCRFLLQQGAATTTRTKNGNGSTPMLAACLNGHLNVAQWLFEVGAAEDIRTKNDAGWTPMNAACDQGHLDVARWLLAAGAQEDVRARNGRGWTPLLAACLSGHFAVAQWLCDEAGASEDVRTVNSKGRSPMFIACFSGRLDAAKWLLLAGAADGSLTTGAHVDRAVVRRDILRRHRPTLRAALLALVDGHAAFYCLLLSAACLSALAPRSEPHRAAAEQSSGAAEAAEGGGPADGERHEVGAGRSRFVRLAARWFLSRAKSWGGHFVGPVARPAQRVPPPSAPGPTSALRLLRGHEGSLLVLIADFAGVARGRKLRIAREVLMALEEEDKTVKSSQSMGYLMFSTSKIGH